MSDKINIITKEQAKALIGKSKQVHTFRSNGAMLIGADWSRKSLLDAITKSGRIEIGGDQCKAMGHGLVVWTGNEPLFIEADKKEIDELEKQLES